MALGRAWCVTLVGLDGHLVAVEADVAQGLPAFTLTGLPDASLNESRDRVRAATANAGCPLPPRRITVNLAPAALPKTGTGFDLAVAVALLAATDRVDPASVASRVHVGELGLDGRVQPVRGILPAVLTAVRAGRPRVVVPVGNAREARLVPGVDVVAVRSLADVLALHRGEPMPDEEGPVVGAGAAPVDDDGAAAEPDGGERLDLADVLGQAEARHALEVAAAGGHNMLLLGPPGAGKTMLAARLPGLLPDLSDEQALEVTAVHSVAGTLDPSLGLLRRPPFEGPHHTATPAALVGGGTGWPRPGAVSRAHRGVLFLDEACEFAPKALDSLRQPLEVGEVVIHRAQGALRFPAQVQLVLASNPCPCGMSSGTGAECTCSSLARRRYLGRLSGPLLDRVDLHLEVLAVSRAEMALDVAPEPTAVVAARVAQARAAQRERLAGTPWSSNCEVPGWWLRSAWPLGQAVTAELDQALDRGRLSIRGYDRVLRVAWTEADLAGRTAPGRGEVGRAILLRQRARVAA
ncbi:YifB family Mg chelatase-like AAA ATPase [Kineosporia sp. R_H_3]|uniref:YifB family Mg chelatase-like AAA ATPase n=1 Tax=Kineosporia sp. R_H_3 TaxID=1961848 RepID=UPI000B4B4695|nr:YifB family Mg chelatase-like AAA ATPase [Kineosporia sp. R_H_3]